MTVAGLYVLILGGARDSPPAARWACRGPSRTSWPPVSRGRSLDRVLGLSQPALLGPAAVALGAVHLALGLAARHRGGDVLRARVTLGLAAVFLTLAIPVQLGLHGVTLAWAVEGVAAPVAGRRPALAADARLRLRRAAAGGRPPLRAPPAAASRRRSRRSSNPAFGTWLAVIVALAAAHALVRRVPEREAVPWLDGAAGLVLAPLGLVLLFGLLTVETQSAFSQRLARGGSLGRRRRRGRGRGGRAAWPCRCCGPCSPRACWPPGSACAAGRSSTRRTRCSRSTAGKVVLVDLATLPTLYRMLSFLALGVLLLAGAWLNLRFRERLTGPGESP